MKMKIGDQEIDTMGSFKLKTGFDFGDLLGKTVIKATHISHDDLDEFLLAFDNNMEIKFYGKTED